MEAARKKHAVWNWLPRRRRKGKRGSLGYVLHEPRGRPEMPVHAIEAHARIECEARAALREWLML